MNNDLTRWLLDVDRIPKGTEESVHLAWQYPMPSWLWACLFILIGLFAVWSYSRLVGWRPGRAALAGVRFTLILFLLVLICGPMLELPRESLEPDWVVMMLDRSASMTIGDAGTEPNAFQPKRVTRDEQLRTLLDQHKSVFEFLDEQRHVVWLGFHAGAFGLEQKPLASVEREATRNGSDEHFDPLPAIGEPSGRRTRIGPSVEQALQRVSARAVSGIVLFSDGRTESPPNRALLRRLQSAAVPVFVVPLGSSEPVGDLAIRRLDVPRRAFIRDKVPVVVELDRLGSLEAHTDATVRLIDSTTGEELDSAQVEFPKQDSSADDSSEPITLTAEPKLAGDVTWHVVIDSNRPDLIPENNTKQFEIRLIDRPLRVLYVEGYPRWEYRYLKNLLVREESIDCSVMLTSADRDFAQEGNSPITRIPRSPEEFADYDVIVLGDSLASFFSPDQLEMIAEHISDRGAGLLWIGGEWYTPSSYSGTALADLLPMRGSLNLQQIGVPVTMTPTDVARSLGVLRLTATDEHDWPTELSDPTYGWSQLFYAQRIEPGQLKPAAEVLAETTDSFSGTPLPLVMAMRYGAGQSIYVATDEIWRWRYGRGELLPDQFWVQMIRMLGRESLAGSGDRAMLSVTPRRVAVHQPVRIELRLLDAQLMARPEETIHAILENDEGERVAEIDLRRVKGSEERYAASFLSDTTGRLRLRIADAALAPLSLDATLEVFAPDDELRRPETDHELLTSLATSTNGKVIPPDHLSQLATFLPNRAVRTIHSLTEPIWDSPLAFGLAIFLLTLEWIGRKMLRFV